MIEITPTLSIEDSEIEVAFIRSAGPGGQNVNKVATAVQLRFDIRASSLPEAIKTRLTTLAGKRVTQEGVLIIEAKEFRSQDRNREAAVERLVKWIARAAEKQKPRTKTRPSLASKQRRLEGKKRKGEIKKGRQQKAFE